MGLACADRAEACTYVTFFTLSGFSAVSFAVILRLPLVRTSTCTAVVRVDTCECKISERPALMSHSQWVMILPARWNFLYYRVQPN